MNDQPKHTPGPWKVTRTNTSIRSVDSTVCRVWMLRCGQGIANAHLIAAAPDLLEALKKLLTECKYMMENGDMMDNRVEISIAEAAIAKAEGRKK